MNIPEIDLLITEKIQSIGEGFLPAMKLISFLGGADIYLGVVMITLLINRNHGLDNIYFTYSVQVFKNRKVFVQTTKAICFSESIIERATAPGYGLPSGHALIPTVFWTYLILNTKSQIFKIIGIPLSILIGISRVYLGVHSLFQVIAGWSCGIVLALGLFILEKKYDLSKRPTNK